MRDLSSSRIRRAIFEVAWITVVRSRPKPDCLCRSSGQRRVGELAREVDRRLAAGRRWSASGDSPVSSVMRDAETVADELAGCGRSRRPPAHPMGVGVAEDVACASSTSIRRPDERRGRRPRVVSAPSSSRMFVVTWLRDERSSDVRGRRSGRRRTSTLRRRIAMRVSRSGGWMSAIRPHSKRERSRVLERRGCRVGGRSELQHDLAAGLVERVEGVEELLLDPLLVRRRTGRRRSGGRR